MNRGFEMPDQGRLDGQQLDQHTTPGTSRRILIVEDEEGIAIPLAFMLRRSNYVPLDAVAYGEQAVDLAGTQRPDLVLMDINLAGKMDGIEAARLIHERYNIPTIYLSALSQDQTIQHAQSSEPYGYLVKPVKEADLRAAIEIALYKHHMEARLRDSEQRYRLLFQEMTDGFFLGEAICDAAGNPVDFRFLAINPAFEQMTGSKAATLVGHTLREALPNYNSDFLVETFGRVALTGESARFEYYLNSIARYLNITAYSPSSRQCAAVAEDITERRRAELSLKESETRFRQLAEGVREVFWLRQRDNGQVLYVSPSYESVFGRACNVLDTDPASFFASVHPDDLPRVEQANKLLQEQGVPFNVEFRILRPDRQMRWIWARSFPVVEDSGQVTRHSGIAEDITERRQSEEQLRESYHRLQQSLRRLMILRNIDQAITTHADQSGMADAILAQVIESREIDAVVLFVPNVPATGRVRGTGPLGLLRLAGLAGLSETVLDSSVMNWQMVQANYVFQSAQPLFVSDLRQDPHPGAQTLQHMAGFSTCAVLPLVARGVVRGVIQFLNHQPVIADSDWLTFLQSLAMQTAIGMDNVENLEKLRRSNRELAIAYDETIKGWGTALELRDKETRGHSSRVPELTVRLAIAMGISGDSLDHIRRGAFLHDIGKIAIPDSIFLKTGPLTSEEWITMRQHPKLAYDWLSAIEYLRPALDVVYCHHEKWDGTGYPRGLKGEEIPLAARIFAVVDVWDALRSDRPYRLAWPLDETKAYMLSQSGKHFDPRVVDAFLKIV